MGKEYRKGSGQRAEDCDWAPRRGSPFTQETIVERKRGPDPIDTHSRDGGTVRCTTCFFGQEKCGVNRSDLKKNRVAGMREIRSSKGI